MYYKIPEKIFQDFECIAGKNFSTSDHKHIETFAYIIGNEESSNGIIASGLIYPDQEGHASHVKTKGMYNILLVGWVTWWPSQFIFGYMIPNIL